MRIAYFTNQYPAPSHTFIQREILALEARGHHLQRYAVRHSATPLVDSGDIEEAKKTRYVTRTGVFSLLRHVVGATLRHPLGMIKAIGHAKRFADAAGRTYLMHMAYLLEAAILADWCRKDKIEHMHVHFGTNPATIAALAHEISGIRFSFTVHGADEFDKPVAWSLRRKMRLATFTVTVSSWSRGQLLRWASPEDWRKIHVVHCGIDNRYLADETHELSKEKRFLCVARLSPEKGHVILLEATRKLRNQGHDFELVFAGDGPLRKHIEYETERLQLKDVVKFLGTISQQDVRSEMLRARAFVLPSFAEGLPVVLMESMALRRAAISTYVAGIPELVRPDNGWIVPAGDADALARAMAEALAADGSEMKEKGEIGRDRVLERHSIQTLAAQLERLIVA